MSINFTENRSLQEQFVTYLTEANPTASPEEQAHIKAIINFTNKRENAKKADNSEIRIKDSEFKIINDLIRQNVIEIGS